MLTNLRFQRTEVEPHVRRLLPQARLMTFTIPWVFEAAFPDIAREIDRTTVIVHWDYELSDERIEALPARLRHYQQWGHEVWFMPTAGFAFTPEQEPALQAQAVLRQVEGAVRAGARGVVYFVGPKWWPSISATSYYLGHKRGK